MSIDEALAAYLLQLEADGRSTHTINQAHRHVTAFGSWGARAGGCADVTEIGHRDVAQFLASTVARTRPDGGLKKASSVNALRSSLRAFFAYLHGCGIISTNPARMVRRARTGPPIPKTVTEDAVTTLLEAIASATGIMAVRDHAMFLTLRQTGIRIGAAVGIDVADVDLASRTLTIRTKGDIEQRVPFGEHLALLLASLIDDRTTGPLFASTNGTGLTTRHVARRLATWCEHAGIQRISPHQLRHTFATALYERTSDLRLVQTALGHRSISSTIVYARVSDDRLRAALVG